MKAFVVMKRKLDLLQGYLVVGYYMTMSNEYVVKWTTPHCVLTLRLIGLAFDIYDGQQKEVSLEAKTALLLSACNFSIVIMNVS